MSVFNNFFGQTISIKYTYSFIFPNRQWNEKILNGIVVNALKYNMFALLIINYKFVSTTIISRCLSVGTALNKVQSNLFRIHEITKRLEQNIWRVFSYLILISGSVQRTIGCFIEKHWIETLFWIFFPGHSFCFISMVLCRKYSRSEISNDLRLQRLWSYLYLEIGTTNAVPMAESCSKPIYCTRALTNWIQRVRPYF